MWMRAMVKQWIGLAVLVGVSHAWAADTFMKPTAEELKMTSLPGYPGAAAVVLYREEISEDDISVIKHYERIKVLTEEGKKYANVDLGFVTTSDNGDYRGNDMSLGEIVGRTIHPDGTIIPFTGKPYLKVLEKTQGMKVQSKVFTLPDVEVGSIIEYRYATRYTDHSALSPDWIIQGDLYVKAAHYQWKPTTHDLVDYKDRPITTISWFPILPPDAKIQRTVLPGTGFHNAQQIYELTVHDIPPVAKESYMPPTRNYTYRVLFNFTPYHTGDEYWKSEGKDWAKRQESFMESNGEVKAATQAAIAGAATDEDKVKRIYAAVMKLENTSYTREHEKQEDKAEGVKKVSNVGDVLRLQRGNADQIAELFVSMVRLAGLKAYLMLVPDRSEELFSPGWLTFRQFDEVIAIVNVGGKEMYLDPGSRYCEYGRLGWEHTLVGGLREMESGTAIGQTPGESYQDNRTDRVANLTMDAEGKITGKIDMTYRGAPALRWRHRALRGDEQSLNRGLQESMEGMLPKTLEVKVGTIENLYDYDQPLKVSFHVTGGMGTMTGKRLVMPVDLFLAGESATFAPAKRETAVYFEYPQSVQDALRVNFPKEFAVEAVPDAGTFELPKEAVYKMTVTQTPANFTTRRTFLMGTVIVPPAEYGELRKFYSQFESKDQESVVVKVAPPGSSQGN
jgi:transglutaminase-like putative cysteine protease